MAIPASLQEAILDEKQTNVQVLGLFRATHPDLETPQDVYDLNILLIEHRPVVFAAIYQALKHEKHANITFDEALGHQLEQFTP
ncbi:MAG: hypothetical protein NT039_01640 [Candidatus Berkelbacteria bacterium]|nr:hypothetical protein [Candidatus Berkelbacteria bacterium]